MDLSAGQGLAGIPAARRVVRRRLVAGVRMVVDEGALLQGRRAVAV
jgi:hypothetical protein